MRIVKKILIWCTIAILLFAAAGAVVTIFYADKVESLVIKELNQKLSRPVEIMDISFSIFSKFPKASVEIQNITVQGNKKEDKPFIKAKKIYLSFNLMSLIRNEMIINEITVEDATVNIIVDSKGNPNYLIFKEKEDSTSQGILNINEVNLINTKVFYTDEKTHFKIKTHSFNSSIEITLGEDKIFNCKWDGVVNRLITNPYTVENIPIKGDIKIEITEKSITYSFLKGKIITLALIVAGNYDRDKALNTTNFELKKGDLKQVMLLLDAKTQKELLKHKLSGRVSAKGTIKDKPSFTTSLVGEFQIDGASVQLTEKFHLQGVDINSTLNWSNLNDVNLADFSIKEFVVRTGNSELKGQGSIRGIKKLNAKLHLEGSVDIPHLIDKLSKDKLVVSSGKLVFNSDVEGAFGDLLKKRPTDLKNFKSKGEISIEDLTFVSKEITDQFSKINGKIHFDNERIILEKFTGKINSSSFTLDGYLYDYLKKNETLSIDAKLSADKLILEEFIEEESQSKNDTAYRFSLPKNLNLNLEVAIGKFNFRKFSATEIKGKVVLANQVLSFNPIFFNSCDGDMSIKGRVITRSKQKVIYEGNVNLNDINIKTAFFQMENFGQEFLLDKHLIGTMNSTVYLHAQSDRELNMDLKKLFVQADISINKGELVQFTPMNDLQEFLKEEFNIDLALNKLKFKTLKNKIEIVNEVIKIPEMNIASNGINLKVSGEHSFDQRINYLFKIKTKEIFKAKNQNSIDKKYGIIKNSDKTSTLPLLMTGTIDNPKFTYDLKAKKQIVKENWVQEGRDIKKVIQKEIKEILGKKDTTVKKENTTKFKVVWDDEN